MPKTSAKKKPVSRPHANPSRKLTKEELEAQQQKHLAFLKEQAGSKHQKWIKSHPSATLGELWQYLERVQDDLLAFDSEDVLTEIIDQLGDAADWLSEWGPVEVHLDDDAPATVEYRLADLEEDIGQVEELIEEFGKSFPVKRLPKPKRRVKKS